MMASSAQMWDTVAVSVDRARRARHLEVPQIAREAGLDDSTVRRVLSAEPVRMSSLRLVLDVVGLDWDELLLSLATRN